MTLRYEHLRVDMKVKRIEGEGSQEKDIGRHGKVKELSAMNRMAGTMTVEYETSELFPTPEVDEACSPHEFEKL